MIIKISDIETLKNDVDYQEFILQNPSTGFVKVRASFANEALPIKGLKVTIQKKIGNNTIIFYEGETDESGMINGIKLPTPMKVKSNEDIPQFSNYELNATYEPSGFNKTYTLSLCCGITVVQYINVTPRVNYERYYNGN